MKTARGRLGLAIGVWAVASGVFAVFSTEYLLAALVAEPSVQSIARGVAYLTTAFTLVNLPLAYVVLSASLPWGRR